MEALWKLPTTFAGLDAVVSVHVSELEVRHLHHFRIGRSTWQLAIEPLAACSACVERSYRRHCHAINAAVKQFDQLSRAFVAGTRRQILAVGTACETSVHAPAGRICRRVRVNALFCVIE